MRAPTDFEVEFDNRVVEGVARLLADAHVGAFNGAPQGLLPLHVGALRPEPVAAVGVRTYPVADDTTTSVQQVGVQVIVRSVSDDVREANVLASRAFYALTALTATDLPAGVHVYSGAWMSGVPADKNAQGHWVRIDNYYLTVNRPGPGRY